ncbi:Rv3654c family TadE-like protein [Streptosporangium carneum]|uniref:Putative Flp pilus-assembly TadG-like N-terminal domain-containing protein n=1 Tax=Streptosporangium carneum TaxID=47481 RepID=A0A9W6MB59_9ACTN|nr:Rv3654c family TadE-like protein [Streptosporangium carneum]GLK07707.1 hypothetical protein GCM10017600_11120 [Streptosporangium carneum]
MGEAGETNGEEGREETSGETGGERRDGRGAERRAESGETGGEGRRGRQAGSGGQAGKGDRGAATIWVVGLMTLIFIVATAIVFAGTARVARHRARSAADLSALTAARLAFADPERGCGKASLLATSNGARLVRCSVDGYGIADVQVTVRFSLPVLGGRVITTAARAGPVHIADAVDETASFTWSETRSHGRRR